MPKTRPFTLELPSGRTLHGLVDRPDGGGPWPTVLVCHGFKGFMEWGFFPCLADLLAARGFTAVRFNFSGSGMRPGEDLVGDLEAFRTATFSQDLEELTAVLAAVAERIAPRDADPERLALLGHSRGGGTALLAAAREPWKDRLRALVTWSAVGTFDRMGADDKAAWRRDGELVITNARTGQELPIGLEVLEDLEAHRAELDLEAAAARRTAPWLLVHGEEDETVPVAEARRLATAASPPCELLTVPSGSHTFGAQHPFLGPTPQLIRTLNATQTFLRRHL